MDSQGMPPGDMPTMDELSLKTVSIPGPSASVRVLAIPDLLEAILVQDNISPLTILKLKGVFHFFDNVISNSPSLKRKTFQHQRNAPIRFQDCTNFNVLLNTMFIPVNDNVDGARKVRVSIAGDTTHVYSICWAFDEDIAVSDNVLSIEIFKQKTMTKVLLEALLKGHLCDTEVGFVTYLKCEVEGEYVETKVWVPGGVAFDDVLEAARGRADGELIEEMMIEENGMFIGR